MPQVRCPALFCLLSQTALVLKKGTGTFLRGGEAVGPQVPAFPTSNWCLSLI